MTSTEEPGNTIVVELTNKVAEEMFLIEILRPNNAIFPSHYRKVYVKIDEAQPPFLKTRQIFRMFLT